MIRRPPRSTQSRSSAASDVYKRQVVPLVEVDEPALGHQVVRLVVNPVARERTRSDKAPLGGSVDKELELERGPHDGGPELHERFVLDAARCGKRGSSPRGLAPGDRLGRDDGIES